MITVTPIYAILLAVIFLILSTRVIFVRRTQKIAYGSGDNTDSEASIRAHANFAEYAPLALLLLLMAELQGAATIWLHLTGLILLVARGLHGYTMGFNRKFFIGRVAGTALTLSALGLLVLTNIVVLF